MEGNPWASWFAFPGRYCLFLKGASEILAKKFARCGLQGRGSDTVKQAPNIILTDEDFTSIVGAIMWGRCINDAIHKFLQFQISTNITAVIITIVSAVASDKGKSVLAAVELLWINIIMDKFAFLAPAADPASKPLLDRKPDTRGT